MTLNLYELRKNFSPKLTDWLVQKGWNTLTPIQELIFKAYKTDFENQISDSIITANTGEGKTEAIFIPLLSRLEKKERVHGIEYIYISPLKALINDQVIRLSILAELLDRTAFPWHQDVDKSIKKEARKAKGGIVLITPESIEGMVHRPKDLDFITKNIEGIIIDEIHSYFNSERGRHLMSLITRLDQYANKHIPRIGISATLGQNTSYAKEFINWKNPESVKLYNATTNSNRCEISLKIYSEEISDTINDPLNKSNHDAAFNQITRSIGYDFSDYERYLIFAGSRKAVELYNSALNESNHDNTLHYEPHHSSIAQNKRKLVEKALRGGKAEFLIKEEEIPRIFGRFAVVSTNTLELGIDIGKLDAIGQIGPGYSVASIRQRMGRSSHNPQGTPKLILYITERIFTDSDYPIDHLRLTTFQALATTVLIFEDAFEIPNKDHLHLSTLIQQTISILRQSNSYGPISFNELLRLLFVEGPWDEEEFPKEDYFNLLQNLNWKYEPFFEISADKNFKLTTKPVIVNGKKKRGKGIRYSLSPSFYAAFKTPREYTIQHGIHIIGRIPSYLSYRPGETILFDGRRWVIKSILTRQNRIYVIPSPSAKAPRFGGEAQIPSKEIITRMFSLYNEEKFEDLLAVVTIPLSDNEKKIIKEGYEYFHNQGLGKKRIIEYYNDVLIFPWLDPKLQRTLTLLLKYLGFSANSVSVAIVVDNCNINEIKIKLSNYNIENLELDELARYVNNLNFEKHNHLFTPYYQRLAYARKFLNNAELEDFIKEHILS